MRALPKEGCDQMFPRASVVLGTKVTVLFVKLIADANKLKVVF